MGGAPLTLEIVWIVLSVPIMTYQGFRLSLNDKCSCRVKDLTDLLLSGFQTVLKLALIVVGLIRLQVARSFVRLIALSCCFFAQSLPLSYQIAPC